MESTWTWLMKRCFVSQLQFELLSFHFSLQLLLTSLYMVPSVDHMQPLFSLSLVSVDSTRSTTSQERVRCNKKQPKLKSLRLPCCYTQSKQNSLK